MRLVVIGAVVALMCSPAFADEASDKQAAAESLVSLTTTQQMIDAMNASSWPPVKDHIVSLNPDVDDETLAELRKIFEDNSAEVVNDASSVIIDFYAREFTLDELQAYVDFYKTPEGKKLLDLTPKMTGELMPVLLQKTQSMMPEVLAALKKAAKDKGLQI